MKIKAGFIQFQPVLGDLKGNVGKVASLLAGLPPADLVVLPELSNSGYRFAGREHAFSLAEDTGNSPFVDALITHAEKHRCHIVAGINEREGERIFNTALLICGKGLIGKYRKIHLFVDEKDYFTAGNLGLPVFDLGAFRVGMLVCFDWMFPEVWRILALKGADVICHPSNLVLPFASQAVPVHGLINRTFNITANRTGTEGDLTFTGGSFISDPLGRILAQATADQEEIRIEELDLSLARNKMITARNHAFDDRVPGAYKELLQ
jgi:predicted amidohydrolase